jgi:hypothetical protein
MTYALTGLTSGHTLLIPRTWRLAGLLYDSGHIGSALAPRACIIDSVYVWAYSWGTSGTAGIDLSIAGVSIWAKPVVIPVNTASMQAIAAKVGFLTRIWPAESVLAARLLSVASGARGLTLQVNWHEL